MKVKLVTNDMWAPALEFTLEQFPVTIGHQGKADISIDDRWTSDRHCELTEVEGQVYVRDLRSELGTLVNGISVTRSVVNSGDNLTLGIRSFRVSYRRRAKPAKPSTSRRSSTKKQPAATAVKQSA